MLLKKSSCCSWQFWSRSCSRADRGSLRQGRCRRRRKLDYSVLQSLCTLERQERESVTLSAQHVRSEAADRRAKPVPWVAARLLQALVLSMA